MERGWGTGWTGREGKRVWEVTEQKQDNLKDMERKRERKKTWPPLSAHSIQPPNICLFCLLPSRGESEGLAIVAVPAKGLRCTGVHEVVSSGVQTEKVREKEETEGMEHAQA
jgi:hypothetical protein